MPKYLLILAFSLMASISSAQDYVIWNGGITIGERESAPNSGTKLVFFVAGGNFLSDIQVAVSDDANVVLVNTSTNGPWLILNLPGGSYTVEAERGNGDIQSIEIAIDENDNSEFGIMFPGS